ncbi:sigma 54-interacting transcriptional regulator [Bacillus sp. H-16]|uniref:HTH-type transcriptional regulatory protein TyrR n=2 Tax=Bacillaceae TaxID=186817 RepID=A0A3M7TN39_9BACI|nr:sigma 54-interacting transcriptional regulator [Alteribacter salitolerans]MBM7096666.1 sigma 54-interacting transcriptional regulator [Alteribacter salitolerans]RNA66363.1 AAA family ATPase [Alteribacter keqinensis]
MDHPRKEFLYIGVQSTGVKKLVSRLKRTEELNRELDAIIDNSYDVIYITDKHGMTLKTNKAIERVTRIPKEYFVGKRVDELIKRGILKNSVTHHVLKKKRTVSFVQSNYEGKEMLITGNPVFNAKGEIEKIVTNARDLTELNELQAALSKATELNKTYKKELETLKGKKVDDGGIVLASEEVRLIYEMANRISNVDATVLILGETGVGKDVLAKYIYSNSFREKEGNFIKVNCGAIPAELLESELFGYEGGAFSGASKNGKAGMFELADKGVLFLDEIGELSLSLQVKLLRALQEQEIMRVGGTKPKKINVRVIAATNRKLKEMVQEGTFREDLYYRLNVIPIQIPPLRERRDDIVPLVNMFLNKVNKKYDLSKTMSHRLKNFFVSFKWSGNVRELSNLIERLVLVTDRQMIDIEHLPEEYLTTGDIPVPSSSSSMTLKEAVERAEKEVLASAAKEFTNTYEIADKLETSQPTIVRKMKKYNIKTGK